ncbi:MAG: protein kinase, partial [Gemmatimonadota bacterium]
GGPPPTRSAIDELRERLAEVLYGRYQIRRTLGVGGMGAVFLAEEIGLEREVAIKVLPPKLAEDPGVVIRFEREARTAARLDHTHIIPIYRVESEGGLHYFVMKYVAGRPLDALIAARGPLPVAQAVRILSEASTALEHAHRKGVVHRDIKPANILLDEDDHILLADFGIAKAVAAAAELTNTGVVIGTPYYMSPEQALGIAVDGRSDQYSLAVVGYRMLTGEALFDADSSMAILYKHIHQPPPRLRDRRPDVPEHIERATLRALAKSPADRFESMAAFTRAIRGEESVTLVEESAARVAAAQERMLTGADTLSLEVTPIPGSRRRTSRLAVLGLVAIAAGGLWWRERPRPAATTQLPVADTTARASPAVTPLRDSSTAPGQVPPTKPAPKRSSARDLTVAPPPFTSAPLTVNAMPFGTLFVDDARVGGTPVVNFPLTRGVHTIRVEREGCKAKEERISVTTPALIKRQYTLECTP